MKELIFWMNEKIFGNNKNQFMLGKLNFCLILKFVVEDRVRNQMEELEMEIILPLQQKWNKYIILISHLKAKSFSFFIEGRSQSRYKFFNDNFIHVKEKTSKLMVVYFTGFLHTATKNSWIILTWHVNISV